MTAWADTFAGRTVASNQTGNWGTASDGESWTCLNGSGATFTVGSGEGTMATPATGQVGTMRLGSTTDADIDCSVRFTLGNTNDTAGIYLRLTSSTSYYRLSDNGVSQIQIGKKTGGSLTSLATATITSLVAGTFYWFRFQCIGTTLHGRVWQDGNTEPTTWNVSTTDASLASGGVGIACNPTTTTQCKFDSFTANTIVTSSMSVTDSVALEEDLVQSGLPSITESVTLADTQSFAGSPALSDSVTLSDVQTLAGSPSLIENVSLSEALSQSGLPALVESVTLSELQTRAGSSSLTEIVSLADLLSLSGASVLAESVSLAELFSQSGLSALTEIVSLADLLTMQGSQQYAESVQIVELSLLSGQKVFSESVALTDIQTPAGAAIWTDSVVLSETITIVILLLNATWIMRSGVVTWTMRSGVATWEVRR